LACGHDLTCQVLWCTQSPSGCPTRAHEIHPPRDSPWESMLPHQPTQIQDGSSGHNDKSQN
jgi:hypothetical protein